MKNLLFVLIVTLGLNYNYSQAEVISVLDKDTQLAISFATITFGDNDGFYTDIDGKFDLNLITSDNLEISSLGYTTIEILKTDIKNKTIYLMSNSETLDEVLITDSKRKFKLKKTKPINDKDFLNSYKNPIGIEIASFIENKHGEKEVQIKSILVPSYNKTMVGTKKQVLKRHPFKTLYKVRFLKNENGFPGDKITSDIILLSFNEKSDLNKLSLENKNIYLPKNGCFITLLNLGPSDETGSLIPTTPYFEKETSKGLMRFAKSIKPYFPVNYKLKKNQTFIRNTFNKDKKWQTFYFKKNRPSEFHNISVGYELKVYN